jgi:hypothetical protein
VFIVENLLWIWQTCFHGEQITMISSNGLAQSQPPFLACMSTIRNGARRSMSGHLLTSTSKEEVGVKTEPTGSATSIQ